MALTKRSKKEQVEPEIQGSAAPAHTMPVNFLGALTLNVASATKLHPVFQSIIDGAREVREALIDGVVNEREAAVRLNQLRARDSRGALWTVGLQSLVWYKRIGNSKWVSSPSPFGSSDDDSIGPWYAMSGRQKPERNENAGGLAQVVKFDEKSAVLSEWQREDKSRRLASLVSIDDAEGSPDEFDTAESIDDLMALLRSSGMDGAQGEDESSSDVAVSDLTLEG